MRRLLHSLVLLCCCIQFSTGLLASDGYFQVTPEIEQAYNQVIELRLEEARVTISQIKNTQSNNLLVYHIENYIDFFTVFINEEEKEYKNLRRNKWKRLEQVQSGDPNSPYHKFVQAEILLQWILLRTKFGKPNLWMAKDLVGDLNKAYRLLEQNAAEHPDFQLNKKSLAMLHALADYAPSWFKKIMSVRGSIQLGMKEINELTEVCKTEHIMYEHEIYAINAYMRLHLLNDSEGAWDVLQTSNLDPAKSGLAAFMIASVALKTGRNEAALKALQSRPMSNNFFKFYYLDWLLGKALLQRLDSSAAEHILTFVNNFKGRHFIKEAYQKLAWYELVISNNTDGYFRQMRQCKANGRADLDDDKQALKEANQSTVPNSILLSARLLYDGGYYQKAYDKLLDQKDTFANLDSDREQYLYRLARIAQALNNNNEAIAHYNQTINYRANNNSFYACNAALQTGLILERVNKDDQAISFFEKCISIKSPIYKSELHKKAKAAIQRIHKKT